jgi:hypothetical protein
MVRAPPVLPEVSSVMFREGGKGLSSFGSQELKIKALVRKIPRSCSFFIMWNLFLLKISPLNPSFKGGAKIRFSMLSRVKPGRK